MGNLLKFELFKINKQKKLLAMAGLVLIFQLIMAIFIKYNEDFMSYEKAVQYSFLAPILVNINTIFLACKIFAEDFEYLTIIPIKSKFPNVSKLMLVKLIVVFLMAIILLFLSASFTIIFSLLLLKYKVSSEIIANVYLYNFSMLVPMSVIVVLISILILLTKKEKTGLALGIIIYLFYGFGTGFNFLMIKKLPIFKYGLVNLMNLPNQLIEPKYIEFTQLSISNMLLVSFISLLIEALILHKLAKDIEV